jgi:RHS repeat-associated protein
MKHDALDRMTSIKLPDGNSYKYSYNQRSLVQSIEGIIDSMSYHPSDRISSILYVNKCKSDYLHDPRHRLIELKTIDPDGNHLQDYEYDLDGVDNISAIHDRTTPSNIASSAEQTFEYDDLYRLTQAVGTGYGTFNFQYDKIGNILHKEFLPIPGITDASKLNPGSYTYGGNLGAFNRSARTPGSPAGPHAVTSTQSGLNFEYDDNGNLVRDNDKRLEWDIKDRLQRTVSDTLTTAYTYDYSDRRITKQIQRGDNATETFYINKYFEVRDGTAVNYVFLGSRRVAHLKGRFGEEDAYTQTINLKEGWNFVSFNVAPHNATMSGVLEGLGDCLEECLAFNASTQTYLRYSPVDFVDEIITIEPFQGYVLKLNCPRTLQVAGSRPDNATISMDEGWNLSGLGAETRIPLSALPSRWTKDGIRSMRQYDPATGTWDVYGESYPEPLNSLKFLDAHTSLWLDVDHAATFSPVVTQDKLFIYHIDHLGSTNVITHANGSIAAEMEYFPFGSVRYERRNGFTSAYAYTNQEREETGLFNYGARLYNPFIGRFITADPIGENYNAPQTLNRYAYVTNNPQLYIDPTGNSRQRPRRQNNARHIQQQTAKAQSRQINQLRKNVKKWNQQQPKETQNQNTSTKGNDVIGKQINNTIQGAVRHIRTYTKLIAEYKAMSDLMKRSGNFLGEYKRDMRVGELHIVKEHYDSKSSFLGAYKYNQDVLKKKGGYTVLRSVYKNDPSLSLNQNLLREELLRNEAARSFLHREGKDTFSGDDLSNSPLANCYHPDAYGQPEPRSSSDK